LRGSVLARGREDERGQKEEGRFEHSSNRGRKEGFMQDE
jgi:hypothetical protein